MAPVQRLTIDRTVALDRLRESRRQHELARELFALAERGEVELAAATTGFLLDAKGNVEQQLHEMFETEGVALTSQLAYPGMYPGETGIPGAFEEGFSEAWDEVIASWKSHEKGSKPGLQDRAHIETHVVERRDVFITDDDGLRVMCRRLRDEQAIDVEAMTLDDYLNRRRCR